MTATIRVVTATLLVACTALSTLRAEIAPLTRDRLEEAAEAGRQASSEHQIILNTTCRTKATYGHHMFEVTLTTPFAAAAYAAFDSKRKGVAFRAADWPVQPPADQRVIISADPASVTYSKLPAVPPVGVRTMVLRRGDRRIEPDRADRHDVLFPGPDGPPRTFRGGTFYFPLEHFAPENGPIEIVVIPESDEPGAEAILRISQRHLSKLR